VQTQRKCYSAEFGPPGRLLVRVATFDKPLRSCCAGLPTHLRLLDQGQALCHGLLYADSYFCGIPTPCVHGPPRSSAWGPSRNVRMTGQDAGHGSTQAATDGPTPRRPQAQVHRVRGPPAGRADGALTGARLLPLFEVSWLGR